MATSRTVVSTLHITLSHNMAEAEPIGRSVSCDDTSSVGVDRDVAKGNFFQGGLKPLSKQVSLSSSSIQDVDTSPILPRRQTSLSSHNITAPTPYIKSQGFQRPTWSSVKFIPKPLPNSVKNIFSQKETCQKTTPNDRISKGGCRPGLGSLRGLGAGAVPTSGMVGGTKLAIVAPLNTSVDLKAITQLTYSRSPNTNNLDYTKNYENKSKVEDSSRLVSKDFHRLTPRTQSDQGGSSHDQKQSGKSPVIPKATSTGHIPEAQDLSQDPLRLSVSSYQNLSETNSRQHLPISKTAPSSPTSSRDIPLRNSFQDLFNKPCRSAPVNSALWKPNRLRPSSLSVFDKSVQSGVVSKGVGGVVMEDGTSQAPVTARQVSSASSVPVSSQRKSSSLPGHYSRGSHHYHGAPQTFRDAFTTSKSPSLHQEGVSAVSSFPAPPSWGSAKVPRDTSVSSINQHQQQKQILNQQQQQQQQQSYQQQQQQQQRELQKLHAQKQEQNLLQYQKLTERDKKFQQDQQKAHHLEKSHKSQKIKNQQQSCNQKQFCDKQSSQSEKKKRSILSGIFRRRKKEVISNSSNSSSSDSDEPSHKRTILKRRGKKRSSKDPLPPPPPLPTEASLQDDSNMEYGKVRETPLCDTSNKSSLERKTTTRVIVSHSGSMGREYQPLGIPVTPAHPGPLTRRGVSTSHDSLPIISGSWTRSGLYAPQSYYSVGGMGVRSSSTDTLGKKERREALKARVERLREKFKDTSSDEEKASVSSHSMHGSESSLNNTNSLSKRSRAARTERFLRRKSQELETLRTETEKDRRTREVVQARIQEIQQVRKHEAERNRLNEEKMQLPDITKPRWSAKLVYQESSEYESSVLLQTPTVSPAASPHMKNKFGGHIPPTSTTSNKNVIMRNKSQAQNKYVTVGLAPPSGSTVRRSFQDFETPVQSDLRGHRSASYDSNINTASFVIQTPYGNNISGNAHTNRYGLTPPAPPPRDRSRIVSPGDGRPMSFSFENINQEVHRPNSSQSSISNFTKGSSPSPSVRSVPSYFGPKTNSQQLELPSSSIPNRRSFSDQQLSSQEQVQLRQISGVPPARPAPPVYTGTHYRYTDQPPNLYLPNQCRVPSQQSVELQNSNSSGSVQFYTDQTPQYAKIVPIGSIPPSPSSDYSSYISDNSIRLQQANSAWRQKEQELKGRVSSQIVPQILSDSSRSNSPKVDNLHSSGTGPQSLGSQQKEEPYGTIQSKSSRPPPISLKQAESLSSLSGQSDVSSPVPKIIDSDSSQGSLAKEKKKQPQNRPLSMVLEKSEKAEKESPHKTTKLRPQPPQRNHQQPIDSTHENSRRQKFQQMIKQKMEHPKERTEYQKEFEEMFRKEKERLERSRSNNFEEALQELEEIYESLKLDSEDLLDGAERRDLPVAHQKLKEEYQNAIDDSNSENGETDSTIQCQSRTRTPKLRRLGVPDKKMDDMHYRRCQQSIRNQPDVQKALQMTGSYLLLSPAHTTPVELDIDIPKDPMLEGEPDVVYDDVSYRNIKQANSIKVIDPQPPFGIPLGPTTQASPNDYLHVTPKENYRPKMIARKQPDITMDDLAFRNLRKDQRDYTGKEVNVSELDEFLSEVNTDSPIHRRKTVRSQSADRARSMRNDSEQVQNKEKCTKLQTPRRVKHQHESRRAGRFTECFKDAVTDSESINSSPLSPRHNPSWLERANLLDNKWENVSINTLDTSTETLTEMSSARAISQPDIRQAIIREARVPPGGPSEMKVSSEVSLPSATTVNVTFKPISVPKLVKVQTIQSAPVSPVVVEKKPYRPLDSIFNNKPKPFYLSDSKISDQQNRKDPVDIAKLDNLISTLSKIESNEESNFNIQETSQMDDKSLILHSPVEDSPNDRNLQSPIVDNSEDEKLFAKANIQKAIKLSMALESNSSEGKRVSSRRRSAIDLPLHDKESSSSSLSLLSTNISKCLNVEPYSINLPVQKSPERVNLLEFPTLPVPASTCTDKIESMVVVSQNVYDRARRAHSVPASPIVVEDNPVFGKIFEVSLLKVPKETSIEKQKSISEFKSYENIKTDEQVSQVKVGKSTNESVSLLYNRNGSELQSNQSTSIGKNLSNAVPGSTCAYASISLNSFGNENSLLHVALDLHENADHECDQYKEKPVNSGLGTNPLKMPCPPLRSSSLPPSPALQPKSFVYNAAVPSSGPPSPTGSTSYHFNHRMRGNSMPNSGNAASGNSSEADDCNTLVRAGSLPPTSWPYREERKAPRDQGNMANRGSLPCPSGDQDEDQEKLRRYRITKGSSPPVKNRKETYSDPLRGKEKRNEIVKEKEKKKHGTERQKEESKRKRKVILDNVKTEAEKALIDREKKDQQREHERLRIHERETFKISDKGGRQSTVKSQKIKPHPIKEKKKSESDQERNRSQEKEKEREYTRKKSGGIEREKKGPEKKISAERERKSPVETRREIDREKRSPSKKDVEATVSLRTPEKHLSSSSCSSSSGESPDKMVQQSSSSGGGVGAGMGSTGSNGGGKGVGSQTDLTEAERAEMERRERIQRYKDERRKQIAARYGNAEWSSSEESATGEETSYKSYRRRRRAQRSDGPDTSSTEQLSKKQGNEGRRISEAHELRLTGRSTDDHVGGAPNRADRLRQGVSSSSAVISNSNVDSSNNNIINNNNNNNIHNNNAFQESTGDATLLTEGVRERGRGEASPELKPTKKPSDQSELRGVGVDSADSTTLSGSDGRSGRRRATGEERDKSNKRKSNLNRSTTAEEFVDTYPPSALPSDSNEDTPRRRRRRAPVSPVGGSFSSVGSSEPLKTPEVVRHVVSRLTSPASPPTHTSPPSPPHSQQSSLPIQPPHTFQPIQPASTQGTHSAPSTLDVRLRSSQILSQESRCASAGLERSDRSETDDTLRKGPQKLAPLRKPEIPDVLRPKENTSLLSPGVVSTPPSSRPSSVVLEKPPPAPEGVRPAAFRSSLRKPPDTGTCFMAARREKRDEIKPEFFREMQPKPKKGDRLSKSDINLKAEPGVFGKSFELTMPENTDMNICATPLTLNIDSVNVNVVEEKNNCHLEALNGQAKETLACSGSLKEDTPPPLPNNGPPEDSADNMVHECEQYLTVNANSKKVPSPRLCQRDPSLTCTPLSMLQTPSAMKDIVSDSGQKNGVGGSEGYGKESKWMALEKEIIKVGNESEWEKGSSVASTRTSGPPISAFCADDGVSPPPEEVVHGLQHAEFEDEDVGSPESYSGKSPSHGGGKGGSRRCSLNEDTPRTNSPDPQSILKRRSSREDVVPDRPTTPEPHSILKRKTSSRNSSIDMLDADPKPILKKKCSVEELDHFEPRPILKKKSSTDDELDDRPRSILKGGRSREDLDIAEGLLSPNPILKRSPRCESEGEGELRPILKRRETTDGVRLRLHVSDGEDVDGDIPSVRVRSDSAPEAAIRMRGHSPPALSAAPSHGILKKRGSHSPGRFDQMDNELGAILRSRRSNTTEGNDSSNGEETPMRPSSPSLIALTRRESSGYSDDRPLSVAERVAGMEAAYQEPTPSTSSSTAQQQSPTLARNPGARPKVMPSSLEHPISLNENDRESRRNSSSAFDLTPDSPPGDDGVEAINEAFLDRPVVAEAFNSAMMSENIEGTAALSSSIDTPSSSVSQKAAFFAQLEQKAVSDNTPSMAKRSTRFNHRRDRGARHATQPVTEEEVSQASRLAEASDSASTSRDSDSPLHRGSPSGIWSTREALMKSTGEVIQDIPSGSPPRLRLGTRKTSLNEPEDDYSSDSLRGILKWEGSQGSKEIPRDSPRSILKHHSDSRRASFSESDQPRGILKPESPLPPPVGSPDHESKVLRGVLKKDSSLEDSKEIKSILKPESEFLDPDHSSDSSSDDVTLTSASTPQIPECDIADSIRDIDPVRHREDQYKIDLHKVDQYHRADFAEALRQVEPIKAKDDLAEALRQIEPIRAKERSRDKEEKVDTVSAAPKDLIYSSTKFTTSMAATMVSSTATSTSSNENETKTSVIKNEAIMRRRNTHLKKYEDRRSMVELRSLEKASEVIEEAARDTAFLASSSRQETTATTTASESSDSGEGFLRSGPWRNSGRRSPADMDATQILRQSPLFRNRTTSPNSKEGDNPSKDSASGVPLRSSSPSSSINARLAALQKNGEDGWKSRFKKDGSESNAEVKLRSKASVGHRERPVSLMERMSALETSSQQWKGRVTQSDASKFTVAHKIASQSASNVPSLLSGGSPVTPDLLCTPTGSPLAERKKRSPCQKVFKSKTGGNIPSLLNKSSPLTSRKDFRRSFSSPNDNEKNDFAVEGTSVSVPQADDENFDAFFTRATTESAQDETLTFGEEDLDHISVTASQLVIKRRSVRVNRRQGTTRNPLRALAAREDIKAEYTEVKMGVGERELRRMKVEELSKASPMAVEALAGLASKENFSAVSLKKIENNPIIREMAPYSALMLLQIKGRRHAQTRLVQPIKSSINQGDDFILITPTNVFHYKGEFANVIERAKAAEIGQYIIQQRDMGISTAKNLIEVDENSPSERKNKFWSLLGGDTSSVANPSGAVDEDGYVEASLVAANKIYEVQGDSLVPVPEVWGQMPKYEILSSDKVLVFDFGAELYVWAGKRACGDERKVGLALGRELWEELYDYSECDINPITPMTPLSQAELKGSRPEWGLCAKLTENVETVLFKEKFIDWPDTAQQSRIKEVEKDLNRYVTPVSELQPCDASVMLETLPQEPDLVLEMSHLGRGVEYYDEEERRLLSISTNDYKVWHVSEYGKVLVESAVNSHLFAGDTYVVRWYYLVTATGRTLKGEPSKHNVTGRSRVAYFFWQGRGSSVSDKGVSALMTVELDEERGPHIRVSMGMEPPAFLNLFKGGLVIHKGHHEETSEKSSCRLYVVRGEVENEGHLVEVDLNVMHLRSRGCLVLVNIISSTLHLWHGSKALRHTRKVASTVAQRLSQGSESVMGWKVGSSVKIKEQFEGAESRDFWEDLGTSAKNAKNKYFSLLEDEHIYDWTPRVWHLAATPDSFQATELICSYRSSSVPNPFPILQQDLYSVPQPALFVVDGGHRVWVWQGWWPAESSEGEDFSATGSAVLRFNFARRAALETVLEYCKLKAKAQANILAARSYKKIEIDVEVVEPYLVVAGMEPLEFTNLFPVWVPWEDVTTIQEKEGRWKHGGQYLVSDILAQLSRTCYSLAELTSRPLPDGADPLHLEVYLSEDEFSKALGMTRDEFYSLQTWKQTEIKKKATLF